MGRRLRNRLSLVIVLLALPFFTSCGGGNVLSNNKALDTFFDIPEKAEEDRKAIAAGQVAQARKQKPLTAEQAEAREKLLSAENWTEARELLPLDRPGKKGRVNWTEAVEKGIIDPLPSEDGSYPREILAFNYDFFYPAPETDPGFEVYFPHSTHTEWVGCNSCHPKIFPVRGQVKLTKKALKKGEQCGVCHRKKGGTAFWLKSCDRCHPNAEE